MLMKCLFFLCLLIGDWFIIYIINFQFYFIKSIQFIYEFVKGPLLLWSDIQVVSTCV
jgi:hypothetical protein